MAQFFPVCSHLDIESNICLALCSRQLLSNCKQLIGTTLIYKCVPDDTRHMRRIRHNQTTLDYSWPLFDSITHFKSEFSAPRVIFPRNLKYLWSGGCDVAELPTSLLSLEIIDDRCQHKTFIPKLDNHPNLTRLHIEGDLNWMLSFLQT